jgi:hypothetical protein
MAFSVYDPTLCRTCHPSYPQFAPALEQMSGDLLLLQSARKRK